MSTLLLRFKAPMQSWGIDSKFEQRATQRFPSKSAVIGLIAASMGRTRHESVDDLTILRFGVRIDHEGELLRDFHTVNPTINCGLNERIKFGTCVTYRDYLADAAFLVGLEGDDELLSKIEYAIKHPVFPLFLGRRSCPPEGRVSLGIRAKTLMDALKDEPWLCEEQSGKDLIDVKLPLRFVLDAQNKDDEYYILRDNPVSFDQNCRKFAFRRVYDRIHDVNAKMNKWSYQKIYGQDSSVDMNEYQTRDDYFASEED